MSNKRGTISIFFWLQPDEDSKKKAFQLVEDWNSKHSVKWFKYPPNIKRIVSYQIDFDDIDCEEFRILKNLIKKYNELYKVEFDEVIG